LELTDFAPLGPAARRWLDTVANVRLHGETQRRPVDLLREEEQPKLRPLPAAAYDAALIRPVRATSRCRVVVETNRYSVPPAQAGQLLTLKLSAERLVAEHLRSYEKRQDVEHPDHVQTLLHERSEARHQRLLLAFLALSAHAPAYHEQLAERRLNLRHHVQKIVALAEIYGAHALGAYSCEYIANFVEQRQRLTPEPGALHLTRASDLLALELPPPDLSPYRASP
jgi:hypothetical protein